MTTSERISGWFWMAALAVFVVLAIAAVPDATVEHHAPFTINNKTNIISDNGTALTFNGTPIGGGGDAIWTNNITALAIYPITTNSPYFQISPSGGLTIVPST